MLNKRLQEAELKAKKRDDIDLEAMNREERKANLRGFTTIRLNPKNKARFSPLINDNYWCLLQHEYLTGAEKALFMDLMVLTEIGTNALLHPVEDKFCNITEIAFFLKRDLRNTRRLIDQLIAKGLIYEFVDPSQIKTYGRVITERPLYLNPEISYAGDRNRINMVLARQVAQFDHLERKNILLPWKVTFSRHDAYARLEERHERPEKKEPPPKEDKGKKGRAK